MGEEDSYLETLAKGAGILFIGSFISKGIMYFYRILVAKQLGPEIYGLLTLGLSVFWISLTITNMGLDGGAKRKISKYIGEGKKERIYNVFWSSFALTMPLSLAIGLLMFFNADYISTTIFDKPQLSVVIKMMSFAVPFHALYSNLAQVNKGMRKPEYITLVDKIIKSLFLVIVTAALVFSGYGLRALAGAQAAAIVISAIMIAYLTQKKVFPVFSRFAWDRFETKKLFLYSYPLFFGSIMGDAMSWTDTLLLGVLETSTELGVYNAAFPTAQLLTVVAGGFSTMLFPTVSELYAKGKKEESVDIASAAIKWIFALNFPMLLLMIAFARPMMRLLFGKAYVGGSIALTMLGTAFFIQAIINHPGAYIKTEDRTKIIFYNSVAAAAVNIILNLILIPIYGNTGAALATAFATTLVTVLAALEVWYLFDVQPIDLRKFWPSVASAVIAAAAVYLVLNLFYTTIPVLMLIPGFGFFWIIYPILYVLFGGITENDLEILRLIDEKIPVDLKIIRKFISRYS